MTESTTTRIKLPSNVHRQVKAAAVLHGIKTAEALGMCVAYLVANVEPLGWLSYAPDSEASESEKGD